MKTYEKPLLGLFAAFLMWLAYLAQKWWWNFRVDSW